MKFFMDYKNLALLVIMIVSGSLLAVRQLTLYRRSRNTLSSIEATQLINCRNAVIIDVRSLADFEIGHLPFSKQINISEIREKITQIVKNKGASVLIVCQNGKQSQKVAHIATEAGYTEVYVLDGGIVSWQQSGMPIIRKKL
ncbi:MAG: rhodanese-like domain-containing protein [Burkholderia sp.]|nr:rhodanese-like domain-containing protein [Burkholderia sp.]